MSITGNVNPKLPVISATLATAVRGLVPSPQSLAHRHDGVQPRRADFRAEGVVDPGTKRGAGHRADEE